MEPIWSFRPRSSSAILSSSVLIFSISCRRFSFSCRSRAMVICEVSSCFSLKRASSFISSSLSALGMLLSAPSPLLICSSSPTMVSWVFWMPPTICALVSSNLAMNWVISWSRWLRRSYLVLALSAPSLAVRSALRSPSCRRSRPISSRRARAFWSSSAARRLSSFTRASTFLFASRGSIAASSCSSSSPWRSRRRRSSRRWRSLYRSLCPRSRSSASASAARPSAWSSASCCSCARACSWCERSSSALYWLSLAGSSRLSFCSLARWMRSTSSSASRVARSRPCFRRNTWSTSCASRRFLAASCFW
mmetsp:Transcript_25259/g.44119  ORF Transcript_25259/g.44119 Transcript_25259/m.44119 type:complete len:307 (-) Transcript_25259:354-1274(-)